MTDIHNDPDVIEFRDKVYTPRMEARERRAYLWRQLPVTDWNKMVESAKSKAPDFDPGEVFYFCRGGQDMVEVHVDTFEAWDQWRLDTPHGGNLSVRFQRESTDNVPDRIPEVTFHPVTGLCKEGHTQAVCQCHKPSATRSMVSKL